MLLHSYQSFNAFTLIGFLIGLAYGSVVLTWLYLGTGGSILAVAIWHGLFNMATATDGATNIIASIVSARHRTRHPDRAAAAQNANDPRQLTVGQRARFGGAG